MASCGCGVTPAPDRSQCGSERPAADLASISLLLNRDYQYGRLIKTMASALSRKSPRLFVRIRPLKGAHWTLPTAIVTSALFLAFGLTCHSGPYYLEVSWLTIVVCIVVWCNHVRRAPVFSLHAMLSVLAGATADTLKLVIVWFCAALPLAIITPAYQCYSDRAKSAEILLSGTSAREEVTAKVKALGTTRGSGKGVTITPSKIMSAGFVFTDGNIVLVGSDPPVVFVMTPIQEGAEVTWQCQGFPEKSVPTRCRHPGK